jgi:DNA polymerase-1
MTGTPDRRFRSRQAEAGGDQAKQYTNSMPSPPRLFLIDTFGLIFRAFYGRAKAGAPLMRTSAGMPTEAVYIFGNMMQKLLDDHKPDYLAAVWEGEGPTFRDEIFADYKANRDETPDDLIRQIPYIDKLLRANSIPVLSAPGYEADDVIGALAVQAAEHDVDVYVVSSDKDLTQLVNDRVYVLNPMKNDLVYDSAMVAEVMGVEPHQIVDFLALKGDAVDNIPGAPGIGDKGARALIGEYGSVESAMEHAAEVKRKTYRESLRQNREQILLSKRLATIAVDAPVALDLEALRVAAPDMEALRAVYKELEFSRQLSQLEVSEAAVETELRSFSTADEFHQWLGKLDGARPVAIAVELSNPGEPRAGGLGFCEDAQQACTLPAHLISEAKPFLEDDERPKRVHDSKSAGHVLRQAGIVLQGVTDDTLLTAFLANATRSDYSLEKTAARRLGVQLDHDPANAASVTQQLGEALSKEIDELQLRDIYEQMELPLAAVLARMEETGVLLDSDALGRLSAELEGKVDSLTAEIYSLAGVTFNINSPKQLGKVLFEDLGLPTPSRRGKTKTPSTASDVLQGLAEDHEIATKILDYRQLTKLKNTYVDALPLLVNPKTGRLHTTFNQAGAATGRVSSLNPNLQNIPIRTEMGRQIRAAFIARPGWNLLKADYSQIELRILAHLSGDKVLVDAFRKGEDIHTRTAAEVFRVPPLLVGAEDRRRAKAVNFGIVYGLSAFGLAQQLGISRSDAGDYIAAYFELYSGVKTFIDRTIAQVRKSGVTRTMFDRLRPIPDIQSKNPSVRGFAERTAINSPIQGSAADLIKLAMIRVDRRLNEENLHAVMLLQVHDELVFEAPEQETAIVAKLVKHEMEQVHQLDVPLIADVKAGKNWRDMATV